MAETAPIKSSPTPETTSPHGRPERDGLTFEALAILAVGVALIAIVVAVFGVGLAMRAIDEHRATPRDGVAETSAPSVTLDEFTIEPTPLEVAQGGKVTVANAGTTVHDLAVEGQEAATPEMNPGDEVVLDLAGLTAGGYTVFCQLPGHRDSGMEGDLTIG